MLMTSINIAEDVALGFVLCRSMYSILVLLVVGRTSYYFL